MGNTKLEPPPFIKTSEFAKLLQIQPDSLRKTLYRTGNYFGVRPQRLPNGRLGWPREQVMNLVYGKGHAIASEAEGVHK